MARARNIKPGFFKNEDLAECSFAARLCFAGLWTLADREGRLEDRPKRIKGELFAFDSVEVEPLLCDLAKHGFILRYAVNGLGLIQIIAFHKHQNPHHREPESELPPPESPGLPPDGTALKPEALPSSVEPKAQGQPEALVSRNDLARGSSRADSGFLIPDSGNGTLSEGVGETKPRRAKRTAKATKDPAPTSAAWSAYSAAYKARYDVEPLRNATVNGQLAHFIGRVPSVEAPEIAAFYVGHEGTQYRNAQHPVHLLLRDAESLRTQWATGRKVVAATGPPNGTHRMSATDRNVATLNNLRGVTRTSSHDPRPEPPAAADIIDIDARAVP